MGILRFITAEHYKLNSEVHFILCKAGVQSYQRNVTYIGLSVVLTNGMEWLIVLGYDRERYLLGDISMVNII